MSPPTSELLSEPVIARRAFGTRLPLPTWAVLSQRRTLDALCILAAHAE
jgi:hypothetical protein